MTVYPPSAVGNSIPRYRGCSLYKSSGAQALTGGQATAITFDAEEDDTDGLHSTSSNTSQIVIPEALNGCRVLVTAGALMSTPSAGYCIVQIQRTRSAVATPLAGVNEPTVVNGSDYYSLARTMRVLTGDIIELVIFPENNGSVTHDARTFLELTVVGR